MTPIIAPERRKFKVLSVLIISTVATAYALFSLFESIPPAHKAPAKPSAIIDMVNVSKMIENSVAGLAGKLKPVKLESVTATEPWKAVLKIEDERSGHTSSIEIDTHTMQSGIVEPSKDKRKTYPALCQDKIDEVKIRSCIERSATIDRIRKTLEKNMMQAKLLQVPMPLFESIYFINSSEPAVVDIEKSTARRIDPISKPMYSSEKNAYFFPLTTGNRIEIKQVDTTGFYTSGTISKSLVEQISWILDIGNDKFFIRYSDSDGVFKNGVWNEKTRKIRRVFSGYDIHSAKSLTPSCTIVFTATKEDGHIATIIANMCNKHGK